MYTLSLPFQRNNSKKIKHLWVWVRVPSLAIFLSIPHTCLNTVIWEQTDLVSTPAWLFTAGRILRSVLCFPELLFPFNEDGNNACPMILNETPYMQCPVQHVMHTGITHVRSMYFQCSFLGFSSQTREEKGVKKKNIITHSFPSLISLAK